MDCLLVETGLLAEEVGADVKHAVGHGVTATYHLPVQDDRSDGKAIHTAASVTWSADSRGASKPCWN